MSHQSREQIPQFILDHLEEYDADELRRIAEYANDERLTSENVPTKVVEMFSMQDSSVVEAAGEHARTLAEEKETPTGEKASGSADPVDAARNGYFELAEEMIEHEADVLGLERSVELARSVDGLEVDSDGNVQRITEDEVTVIGDLVDCYIDQLGKVTEVALQHITRDYRDELELPDNLT